MEAVEQTKKTSWKPNVKGNIGNNKKVDLQKKKKQEQIKKKILIK